MSRDLSAFECTRVILDSFEGVVLLADDVIEVTPPPPPLPPLLLLFLKARLEEDESNELPSTPLAPLCGVILLCDFLTTTISHYAYLLLGCLSHV